MLMTTALLALATAPQDPAPGAWRAVKLTTAAGTEVDAEYCYLPVPENRAKPAGKRIEIGVARLRGVGTGPPIVYLHGGPGGSATGTLQNSSFAGIWEALLELGDVVLVDQRGCGRSRPALYWQLEDPIPHDVFTTHAAMERFLARASEFARGRYAAAGIDPSAFNNLENAADIDDVRRALGVDRIRLLGFSFGSHLGLTYLRRYPDAVESAVLIGVEGPDHTRKLPRTLHTHWQRLMARARTDPAMAEHRAELDDLLPRALARLEREPLRVDARDPITGEPTHFLVGPYGLRFLLAIDLGDTSDIPILPRLVAEVARGETAMLQYFVQRRSGMVGRFPVVLFTMDTGAGASPARAAAIREQSRTSLFANAMNLEFPAAEAVWRPVQFSEDYRQPVVSPVRTLFISGELDSNTPPHQAEQVRWGFANATHLIADNAGHESSWLRNDDAILAIAAFFGGDDVRGANIDLPPLRFAPLAGPTRLRHPALR